MSSFYLAPKWRMFRAPSVIISSSVQSQFINFEDVIEYFILFNFKLLRDAWHKTLRGLFCNVLVNFNHQVKRFFITTKFRILMEIPKEKLCGNGIFQKTDEKVQE